MDQLSEKEIQNLINKIFEKKEPEAENVRKAIQAGDKLMMGLVHSEKFSINGDLADRLKELGPLIITPILTHICELKEKRQLAPYLSENNFYGSSVYLVTEAILELENLESSITPKQLETVHKMLGWKEFFATQDKSTIYNILNIVRDAGNEKTITVLLNIIVKKANKLSKDSLLFIVNVIKDIRRRLRRSMKSSR